MQLPFGLRKLLQEYGPILRPGAVLLVIIVAFFVGVVPLARKSLDLWNQNRSLSRELTLLRHKAAVVTSLDPNALRTNLGEIDAAVPTDKSVPSILTTVEGLSGQVGVSLLDLTLSGVGTLASESGKTAAPHPSGAQVVHFSATVEGTLSQIYQMLRTLSTVRRFMGIRSFDMAVAGNGNVRTKFEMDAYWHPLPSAIGSVESQIEPLTGEEESEIANIASLPNFGFTSALPPPSLGGPVKADPFSP